MERADTELTIKKKLYYKWDYIKKQPHSEEFNDFPGFYDWAIKEGYRLGDRLIALNKNEPFSPENCCFTNGEEITQEWADDWSKRWETTVGCIRKLCGLPPLEGGENNDKSSL